MHRGVRSGRDGAGGAPVAAALLVLGCLGAQCDKLVPAIGPSGEVVVVTHLPAQDAAYAALRQAFEREVLVVRPEPAFRLEALQASQLDRVKHTRNLAVMVDLSRRDALTERLRALVGEALYTDMVTGHRFDALYADVWANGQSVLVLAAPTADQLERAIRDNADRLFQQFEESVLRQTLPVILAMGEQTDYRSYLGSKYGWSLRIPKGYIVSEDEEEHVVRCLMTQGGVRLMFVHWQDGHRRLPSPDECADIRARVAYLYDQDTMPRELVEHTRGEFLSYRTIKLNGIWQNERDTKGGPFRTVCFMDGDRFYMIDMLVFAPNSPKLDLMRQVEAIARTFRDERE